MTQLEALPNCEVPLRSPTDRCRPLKHMIDNTPLLAIRFSFIGRERVIYAKVEHMNLPGSIKDRMASTS